MKKVVIFNANHSFFELLTLAAEQREVSRADFIRQAVRKEASRVLAGTDTTGREERPPEAAS